MTRNTSDGEAVCSVAPDADEAEWRRIEAAEGRTYVERPTGEYSGPWLGQWSTAPLPTETYKYVASLAESWTQQRGQGQERRYVKVSIPGSKCPRWDETGRFIPFGPTIVRAPNGTAKATKAAPKRTSCPHCGGAL